MDKRKESVNHPSYYSGDTPHEHHTGLKTSHHAGTKTFWEKNNIDRDWILTLVVKLYEASK